MCNSSSNPCDQICKKQAAYDKAVESYQFHVQRYHTWVNYYAIFVGALFVAFYLKTMTFVRSILMVC